MKFVSLRTNRPHARGNLDQARTVHQEASSYDVPTNSHEKALLKTTQHAHRPQPVDYGLTYDDLNLYSNLDGGSIWRRRLDKGKVINCLGTRSDDKYKKGRRWFGRLIAHRRRYDNAFAAGFCLLFLGALATISRDSRPGGIIFLGLGLACLLYGIVPGVVIKNLRTRASSGLIAYWQALHAYDDNKTAAKGAARAAARETERRKRSYWEFLDGYQFERATAKVLKRHQFNPRLTGGSADDGVDIEVTRGGWKGVVQCKADVACVGPHVVRDLYGVLHHSKADFGIIVSRGGFSTRAIDFARHKPIFFLDLSDLIKMQEGLDVLSLLSLGAV